jgi:putative membrane protein
MTTPNSRIGLFFVIMVAVTAFGLGAAIANAMSDRDFVRKAENANLLEVSLGEMAQQQAASPEVKQFGGRMAKEHTLASNKLLEISKKDKLEAPGDLDRKEYEMVQHLSGLKGRDFDRAYIKHMVENHKEDLQMFEQMAKEGANPDLRDYAKQTLSTLREHLKMAQDIYNKIERQG